MLMVVSFRRKVARIAAGRAVRREGWGCLVG